MNNTIEDIHKFSNQTEYLLDEMEKEYEDINEEDWFQNYRNTFGKIIEKQMIKQNELLKKVQKICKMREQEILKLRK